MTGFDSQLTTIKVSELLAEAEANRTARSAGAPRSRAATGIPRVAGALKAAALWAPARAAELIRAAFATA